MVSVPRDEQVEDFHTPWPRGHVDLEAKAGECRAAQNLLTALLRPVSRGLTSHRRQEESRERIEGLIGPAGG